MLRAIRKTIKVAPSSLVLARSATATVVAVEVYIYHRTFSEGHHVFAILHLSDGTYVLLETRDHGVKISFNATATLLIHREHGTILDEIQEKRALHDVNYELQGVDKVDDVIPMSDIEEMINEYHNQSSDCLACTCRHFVDSILRVCHSARRCPP